MGKQGKNNALILYQVLMKYSDKEHPLSMSDIKDYMAEETAECGRDSIARYLNQLEEEMGIDIHRGKGQAARYYLYGYDTFEKDGVCKERHYRVDKLDNIEIMETDRQGKELFMHFNADTYVAKRMGMYTDKERRIKVRIPESLVGTFIDQFGKWIDIKEESICQQDIESADNEHNEKAEEKKLVVTFCAVKSNVLLGWLIGLGNVEMRFVYTKKIYNVF